MLKFVHIADLHFDSQFSSLGFDEYLSQKRKLEQRSAFRKVVEYIKENGVEYFFIGGDLYENEYIQRSTIEFINNLFEEIPDTKVFITPGNHDPNVKGSIYDTFEFASNVKVFKSEQIEKYEDENVQIYGFGFEDFYMNESPLENFKLEKSDKTKFLIMHGDVNGVKDNIGRSYNPISETKLRAFGFDYVALGHIHKNNFDENNRIIYPGSLVSLGFDELGSHGMIVGEFIGKNIKIKFEAVDEREFIENKVNVDEMNSQNDLIEYLTTLYFEKNSLCKIVLVGKRKFFINTKDIMYLIDNPNIIRIKDETSLWYDLEIISKENTLKGVFVRKLLEKKQSGIYSEEEIQKAIEIGLEAMNS